MPEAFVTQDTAPVPSPCLCKIHATFMPASGRSLIISTVPWVLKWHSHLSWCQLRCGENRKVPNALSHVAQSGLGAVWAGALGLLLSGLPVAALGSLQR